MYTPEEKACIFELEINIRSELVKALDKKKIRYTKISYGRTTWIWYEKLLSNDTISALHKLCSHENTRIQNYAKYLQGIYETLKRDT